MREQMNEILLVSLFPLQMLSVKGPVLGLPGPLCQDLLQESSMVAFLVERALKRIFRKEGASP